MKINLTSLVLTILIKSMNPTEENWLYLGKLVINEGTF
jgi:hypothetical protein